MTPYQFISYQKTRFDLVRVVVKKGVHSIQSLLFCIQNGAFICPRNIHIRVPPHLEEKAQTGDVIVIVTQSTGDNRLWGILFDMYYKSSNEVEFYTDYMPYMNLFYCVDRLACKIKTYLQKSQKLRIVVFRKISGIPGVLQHIPSYFDPGNEEYIYVGRLYCLTGYIHQRLDEKTNNDLIMKMFQHCFPRYRNKLIHSIYMSLSEGSISSNTTTTTVFDVNIEEVMCTPLHYVKISLCQRKGSNPFTGFVLCRVAENMYSYFVKVYIVNGKCVHMLQCSNNRVLSQGERTTRKKRKCTNETVDGIRWRREEQLGNWESKKRPLKYIEVNPNGDLRIITIVKEARRSSFEKLNDENSSLWSKLTTLHSLIVQNSPPPKNVLCLHKFLTRHPITSSDNPLRFYTCQYLFNPRHVGMYNVCRDTKESRMGSENFYLNYAFGIYTKCDYWTQKVILEKCLSKIESVSGQGLFQRLWWFYFNVIFTRSPRKLNMDLFMCGVNCISKIFLTNQEEVNKTGKKWKEVCINFIRNGIVRWRLNKENTENVKNVIGKLVEG
jgi:hypothetical protein